MTSFLEGKLRFTTKVRSGLDTYFPTAPILFLVGRLLDDEYVMPQKLPGYPENMKNPILADTRI